MNVIFPFKIYLSKFSINDSIFMKLFASLFFITSCEQILNLTVFNAKKNSKYFRPNLPSLALFEPKYDLLLT